MTRQAELQQWLTEHSMLDGTAAFERAEARLAAEVEGLEACLPGKTPEVTRPKATCLPGKTPEPTRPKGQPRFPSGTPSAIERTLGTVQRVLPSRQPRRGGQRG